MTNTQVLVRRKKLHGSSVDLVPADVVKQRSDGSYLIKYRGALHTTEVAAADVIPAARVYGGQPGVTSRTAERRVHQQFPKHLGGY